MKKVKGLVLFAALVALAWLALLAQVDAQQAEALPGFGKVQVINITPQQGLVPENLEIQRGTTVVWANSTQGYIAVIFSGGKAVQRACVAPVGFQLTERGEYATSNFPPGGTASLCFVEAGAYQYLVHGLAFVGGGEPRHVFRGWVRVK